VRTPGVASEYLIGVLTNLMGPHAGCSTSVTISRAKTVSRVSTALLSDVKEMDRLTMLVIQGPLNVVDRRIRHTATLEDIQPLLRGLLHSGAFDHTIYLCTVLHSVTVSDEAGVSLPLREAQSITQHAKQPIVATAEENITVAGFVAPVGYNGCWIVSV
jgi:hypothetical protein